MTQEKEHRILVKPSGQIRMIYDDDLVQLRDRLGPSTTRRASHVEPDGTSWLADMTPCAGPVLGPFATRGEALQAEVAWLHTHGLPNPQKEG